MMLKRTCVAAASALIVGTMLLSGCSGKPADPKNNTAAAAPAKPPLVVPTTFNSEAEKLNFAVKAIGDGYFAEATPLLEDILKLSPNGTVYSSLGVAKYNLGNTAGAIEAWSNAAALQPEMKSEMKNNIGNALRDSQRYDEAEAAYRDALRLDPGAWQTAANLATMFRMNGKVDEAIAVLEQAVQNNSKIEPLQKLLSSMKASIKPGA